MKKVVTILMLVALVFVLSCSAFAAGSYTWSNGYVTGEYTYEGSHWIETQVNGQNAGGAVLNFAVPQQDEPQDVVVTVYQDFVLVGTYTVHVPGKAVAPTAEPTAVPTAEPTAVPTAEPTAVPTAEPTAKPTAEPTAVPTAEPTAKPTAEPTAVPTAEPTAKPTAEPTAKPTAEPTAKPVETKTPSQTTAPGGNSGSKTSGSAKPAEAQNKVGEADYTVVLLAVVLAGATGMVVLGKKRKEN